ncbi:MAG TPA: transcription-repair coupling factor [Bacteroidales bacterium]|nr:transcription-repair coupling factor [Bacteroidales bacterium]
MALNELVELYRNHPGVGNLTSFLRENKNAKAHCPGLAGSSKSIVAAALIPELSGIHLVILPEKEDSAYFYNDLVNLLGNDNVLFFPSSFKRSVHYNQIDSGNVILRTNVVNRLGSVDKTSRENFLVIVTYPEGLAEKVITQVKLKKNTLLLNKGEKISISFIREMLEEYRFSETDFVYEPGQYAIRGSLVDVFSFANPDPYRIDFFGDEVESIRTFDVENQLSKNLHDHISILPNVQELKQEDISEPLTDYLDSSSVVWITDVHFTAAKLNDIYDEVSRKSEKRDEVLPVTENQLTTGHYLVSKIPDFSVVEFASRNFFPGSHECPFNTLPQPAFSKNFNLLAEDLLVLSKNDYKNYILSDSEKQIERLSSIFKDINSSIKFHPLLKTLHEGFIDRDLKVSCYTDHQIFERYHKYTLHNYFSNRGSLSLKELKGLQPGDYVVHIDHGIGKFGGLEKIDINGKIQESIRLVYQDNDVLYVSIHSLHRISKYKGKDNEPPRMYKLGTGAWQKLKQSTSKKIKDIARELIDLYARRKMQKGFAFSPDTYMQNELEASFIYEDTPDQVKSTLAIKEDMESENPMDRLVCGDVGFGKTELAVRAAFKAVADSKQVAILVPTTILALQHYNTFKERLASFPCNLEYINRFKKGTQQTDIIKRLAEGKIDIIIGTHRLLGADIRFKDLGLLIIDEEQKFGVSAKEKLKNLKVNVDTLTLTATPIPRTLQFSLMGARDLSVINTPPPNRHPIITELHVFNDDIIREGIEYELSRGGQVFFINNRVQNIYEVETLIRKICPGVKTCVAHGQMEGPKLEQVMTDFVRADYDVLIATTLIESGLDIPNANTIFINNAHHFGLSDLHQLRGRVGRSNKKAFCYLLAPPPTVLTPEARRRLKAIEELSELGSGFNIALHDLDIRGAGNMLGGEQSGFIADIGFETYTRILNEAIADLKENEYKELFARKETAEQKENKIYVEDCQLDTDMELLFPDDYVSNVSERMSLYRELDQVQTEEELVDYESALNDRFGPLPDPSKELLQVVRLRWLANRLGFEKLVMKNGKMIGYFISNQKSDYYKTKTFSNILSFVQKQPSRFRMKEGNDKLTLTCEPILSVESACNLLKSLCVNEA